MYSKHCIRRLDAGCLVVESSVLPKMDETPLYSVLLEPTPGISAGQYIELGKALLAQRVGRVGVSGRMAHQQVAVLQALEPACKQTAVCRLSAPKIIHSCKPHIQVEPQTACVAAKRCRAQGLYDPRLGPLPRGQATQGNGARTAQPGPRRPCIAARKNLKQDVADLRQLMHVLVAVHEIGRPAKHGFERFELTLYLGTNRLSVEPACIRTADQRGQGQVQARPAQRLGKVQVQPHLRPCAGQSLRMPRKGGPQRQATGGTETALLGQAYDAGVDRLAHPEIIGAQHDPLYVVIDAHKPSFGKRCT